VDTELTENDSPSLPQNKAELMARLQREWAAVEQAISGLTEAQMVAPGEEGWSVKDHLAHLTHWEQILVLSQLGDRPFVEAANVDDETARLPPEGGLNESMQQRDKDRPLAEVLADSRRSHQQVLDTLDGMDFAYLMRPRYPDDPDRGPLINWVIGNTYEHYREHREYIQTVIRQVSKD